MRWGQQEQVLRREQAGIDARQRARLDKLSAPELPFPAWANRLAPALQFAGATVDGQATGPALPGA